MNSRWILVLPTIWVVLTTVGCASIHLGAPQPSFEVVRTIGDAPIKPLAVGLFTAGADLSPDDNRVLGVRAEQLEPPETSSYADYLHDLLTANLASAGKLEKNGSGALTISGHLDRNKLSAASFSTNNAQLGATFVLTQADSVLFTKRIDVESSWDSSAWGVQAIPGAINQYSALYKALLSKLFQDAEFRSVAAESH